jgi:hypothetical protein
VKDDPPLPPGMHPAYWRALCQEHEQEIVDDLMRRLVQGSNKTGVNLTANECAILLNYVIRPKQKPEPKKGRPLAKWDDISGIAQSIILHMYYLAPGASVTEAVRATAAKFNVSVPTVWKHWKAWNSNQTKTWKGSL